ncbi:MAG: hypothetical protein RQ826_13270 [Xanthomonadales bacterium]|nr:hypothetical protein [Xanthomonadales bacterium]
MRNAVLILSLLLMAACNGGQETAEPDTDAGNDAGAGASAAESPADEVPADAVAERGSAETASPESDYERAFENQTRAPKPATTEAWTTETVAEGLVSSDTHLYALRRHLLLRTRGRDFRVC